MNCFQLGSNWVTFGSEITFWLVWVYVFGSGVIGLLLPLVCFVSARSLDALGLVPDRKHFGQHLSDANYLV